jgi:glycolate oxidase FAD binding subunit
VAVLGDLVEVCGSAHARPAGPADAVGGVPARWVAAPGDADQLSAVLRVAVEGGLAVVPRGAGTKLDWGPTPSTVDILVDVGRLAGIQRHEPGELVATFGAGTPVDAVRSRLAALGQRLALDPPSSGATVGGALAANETGPLRFLAGEPRSLVLGAQYAGADGRLATAGATEAGDLCGSYGTLGVLTTATLRLHPLPPARTWVRRSVRSPLEVHDLVMLLETTPLNAVAVEADLPATADPVLSRVPRQRGVPHPPGPGAFAIQIEGTVAGVADRSAIAVTLLGGDASVVDRQPEWWGRYPFGPQDVGLKLVVPTPAMHAAVYAMRDAAGAAATLRGSVGSGVMFVALPPSLPAPRVANVLTAVRDTLLARGGSCTVLQAPPEIRDRLDGWAVGSGEQRARALKRQYDPDGRLAPGRLPEVGPIPT